jgi:hypothetical protein
VTDIKLRVVFTVEPRYEAVTPAPVPVAGVYEPLRLAVFLVSRSFDPRLLQGTVFVHPAAEFTLKATVEHDDAAYWAQAVAEWMEYVR